MELSPPPPHTHTHTHIHTYTHTHIYTHTHTHKLNSLRRNWILEQPLLFTGCSSIQFFNSFFVAYRTPCCTRCHHSHLIFCDLQDTIPHQRSPLSFLTQLIPRRAEDVMASILRMCFCLHS